MNEDMNKLLRGITKYDLGSGLLISLVISLSYSFLSAIIYFIGICVGLLNFWGSWYVTSRICKKGGSKTLILLISFFRITLIAMLALIFINDISKISFYLLGLISHYIILMIYALKNRKGSV